jgi:hypothetical protein
MPELTPESTPPPSAPIPPDPDDEAIGPPVIDPARFEDFPVFRETFLSFIAQEGANATLRDFGELLYRMTLEYWQYWPDQPEGHLRASLRAAVADMRHVQGFLAQWAGPETDYKTPHGEHLAKVGGGVARDLGVLADRLETELGPWRGEAR